MADIFALELQCEFGKLYGKVSVGFVVLGDEDSGQMRGCIQSNQHLDRTIISALERFQFGRPEYVTRNRL